MPKNHYGVDEKLPRTDLRLDHEPLQLQPNEKTKNFNKMDVTMTGLHRRFFERLHESVRRAKTPSDVREYDTDTDMYRIWIRYTCQPATESFRKFQGKSHEILEGTTMKCGQPEKILKSRNARNMRDTTRIRHKG